MNHFYPQSQVFVITGAGSGIGEQTAFHFAKHKARLAMVDINRAGLDAAVKTIRDATGADILPIYADLTNDTECERIIDETSKKFNQIDVLINNAGDGKAKRLDEEDINRVDFLMKLNLRAPIFLSKLAYKHLSAQNGSIINICSMSADVAFRSSPFYGISKAGLDAFTQYAAAEFAAGNVRVNSIKPGYINTPLFNGNPDGEAIKAHIIKTNPMGRLGTTKEVASTISFLLSMKHMTGASIRPDGASVIRGQWELF